jgi:hypothetical protein
MAGLTDDIEFEKWFDVTITPTQQTPPKHIDRLRTWARGVFETCGAVSRDVAAEAMRFDQIAVVESAVAKLTADLQVVSNRVPEFTVDVFLVGVRVTVDGGFTDPSVFAFPWDVAEATIETVEYVREQLAQDRSVSFPVCSRHDRFYLHPTIDNGVAVWRCNRGEHVVATIGQLNNPPSANTIETR